MIIKDDIGEDYENLFYFVQEHPDSLSAEKGARNLLSEKIRVCVLKLHQAGFVHGDIRDICLRTVVLMMDLLCWWTLIHVEE